MFVLRFFLLLTVLLTSPLQAALQVSVGIEPMRYLVEQIGGERVAVSVLLANGDPHALDPTPTQLVSLKKADIYFGVGLPFERGLGNRLDNGEKLLWLDEGDRVTDSREHEEPNPISLHNKNDGHHAHILVDGKDPHRWTAPGEMLRMGSLVSEELQQRDPSGQAYYTERFQSFAERVELLQKVLAEELKSSATALVADHPSWGWFAQEFNLIQLSVEHEGKPPSIRQMSALKKSARENGARYVVSQHGNSQAQTVASHLGLKLLVVNPLSYDWEVTLLSLAEGLATQ